MFLGCKHTQIRSGNHKYQNRHKPKAAQTQYKQKQGNRNPDKKKKKNTKFHSALYFQKKIKFTKITHTHTHPKRGTIKEIKEKLQKAKEKTKLKTPILVTQRS